MNELYRQYGQTPNTQMIERFKQFQQAFKGNPQQIIQQMLNSGQITQAQLNNAMQMANQLSRFIK